MLLSALVLAGTGCKKDTADDTSTDYPNRENPDSAGVPGTAELTGSWEASLEDGSVPDDLQFLVRAQCVPGTELENFDGAHVYATYEQPAARQVYVRVRPERGLDVSLYVSQLPGGSMATGQDAISVPCEESLDYQYDSNPGEAEVVKLTSIDRPYHLVIGVAGADGADEGDFLVEVFEE